MFNVKELTFRKKMTSYRKRANEIEAHLKKYPREWGKFQSEFNQEVNGLFRELMLFEKENIIKGNEQKVYKMKKFFEKHIRQEFARGQYCLHSLQKPHGYAGDYEIIDWIYQNYATSAGFERLFDNYFLQTSAAVATRNRKEDFKRIIYNFLESRKWHGRILDLASGPCRDIYELFKMPGACSENVYIDFLDGDSDAIEAGKCLVSDIRNVRFIHDNVVKIALRKDLGKVMPDKYDLIFSTGLFDYLEAKLATRLIANLKKMLCAGGMMIISNYRDKYSNPSIHFMEWAGDWNLVYRTEEEFMAVFVDAGFAEEQLSYEYEQQGIMQYCFAKNALAVS